MAACFRILTVVDQFTRECVALEADRSMTGRKVAETLERAREITSARTVRWPIWRRRRSPRKWQLFGRLRLPASRHLHPHSRVGGSSL